MTVVIWSFNFTLTKYVLEHGFKPLAYSGVRFTSAALLFAGITLVLERSLRMARRDVMLLFGAVVIGIWLNQLGFVYSLTYTTASTAANALTVFVLLIVPPWQVTRPRPESGARTSVVPRLPARFTRVNLGRVSPKPFPPRPPTASDRGCASSGTR